MVNRRSTSTTPEPILQLQRQLEDFRSSQSGPVKLPDSLWQEGVELARQYGIWSVAHPLPGLKRSDESPRIVGRRGRRLHRVKSARGVQHDREQTAQTIKH